MKVLAERLIHHGGRYGVTGSCHELRLPGGSGLLVDCGLFQGDESDRPLEIEFPVAHLCGLVVTHVHIDHVGRLPYLLAAGFRGPIYCSEASARLLPTVLEDALQVGFTRDRRLTERFLELVARLLQPLPYGRWQQLDGQGPMDAAIRLRPAGHILGSASVECRFREAATGRWTRILFSGDLGAPYAPLLPAPKPVYAADLVVLESTYGDRRHAGRRTRRGALQQIIERSLADRGVILVPAFSIGRTQELLYEIEELIHRNRQRWAARDLPWEDLEILLDSPLAQRFTTLYRELQPFWDREAKRKLRQGRRPLSFSQLNAISDHVAHQKSVASLRRQVRPCIVIAASGMCTGGRIVNYLQALLGDPRTDILFTGYQAAGTPGRAIQTYGPRGGYVDLDGQRYPIRAGVHTLTGYSAHADQDGLVRFVRRMRHLPRHVRLVHGEDEARQALQIRLETLGIDVD